MNNVWNVPRLGSIESQHSNPLSHLVVANCFQCLPTLQPTLIDMDSLTWLPRPHDILIQFRRAACVLQQLLLCL